MYGICSCFFSPWLFYLAPSSEWRSCHEGEIGQLPYHADHRWLGVLGSCFPLPAIYPEPWTRDCQVRANTVGIAPRVSGPIIHVAVHDNQEVKRGDLVFEIDPTDFHAQVDVANGQVQNDEATLKQQQQNLDRQTNLYQNHVVARQDFQNAQDSFAAAQAELISAKANLQLAKPNLGYTKVYASVD